MLPNSATGKRTIPVARGTPHTRTINAPSDPNQVPIVERMTRARFARLSASQAAKYRNESIKALQDLSPSKAELADSFITQFFQRRHTHEAPSPVNRDPVPGAIPTGVATPASTPGKWFAKKKTDSARKRGQKRRLSPSKLAGDFTGDSDAE